jgi:hypothetical protein
LGKRLHCLSGKPTSVVQCISFAEVSSIVVFSSTTRRGRLDCLNDGLETINGIVRLGNHLHNAIRGQWSKHLVDFDNAHFVFASEIFNSFTATTNDGACLALVNQDSVIQHAVIFIVVVIFFWFIIWTTPTSSRTVTHYPLWI